MKTSPLFLVTGLSLAVLTQAFGSPTIITEPQGRSADRGFDVVFSVTAVSPLPITYQWRKGTTDLPDETSDILVLLNVQTNDAGSYTVVVSDTSGSVTSQVATLTVDATFTKITSGAIVNDGGASAGAAWADYDNDGWLDLFVVNTISQNDFLYRNNGNATFTRITAGVVVNDGLTSTGSTWGDYDNDGSLDLFVAGPGNDLLYRNNGNGTFTRITDGPVPTSGGSSSSPSWVDYDNDGDLDLYMSNNPGPKFLYRNEGDGTFTKVTTGILVTDPGNFGGGTWGDYDNDGDLDPFVCGAGNISALYRNDGGGNFTKITQGILVNAGFGCAWGDYDNDGWLDLFVCVGGLVGPGNNLLYHNNGDGTFSKITSGAIVTDTGNWLRAAWADYDNDSFLDLFVSNYAGNNALYHNNGNGTFTGITTGSVVNDGGQSAGGGWGDYDNDGFLDLFVANGRDLGNENNFLYRNNGNSNSWIKVRLVGYASNRHGVGAKVKVNAIIGGTNRWLTRSIDGSDVNGNASALVVGLGDATNVSTLRIEWPSGLVRELHEVAVNQPLTVTETGLAITRQPRDHFVFLGRHATNNVRAGSDQPISYQWRFSGTNLPGQTNASLILTNAQVSQEGEYTVLVANGETSVLSTPGRLTVVINPVITHAPANNFTNVAGATITLGASIAGAPPPFFYVWRSNSLAIRTNFFTASTSDFITVQTPSTPGVSNTFRLEVTNLFSLSLVTFTNRLYFTNHTAADSDGDGLPDFYESAYGGVGGVLDPVGDADGDTMSNVEEYLAGTNPTNAASYLKVESITAAGGAMLQFGAVANRTYTIQYSPGPGGGTWANLAHFASRPADHVESFFDSADATNRFYRVATPKAP